MIILLFCSPKSPACDSGGTELDVFDTQGTLEGGRLEYNCFYDHILRSVNI